MLYKTHKKFGYLFGLLGLLISMINGWILTMPMVQGFGNKFYLFFLVYIAIRGAVFGACFPDIDSKGSVPARHYPFLRKVFRIFKIKHRGKISHDYVSISLIFLVYYVVMAYIVKSGQQFAIVAVLLALHISYIIARDIINHSYFYLVKDRKKRRKLIRISKPIGAVIVFIIFQAFGLIQMGGRPVDLLITMNFVGPLLKTWIIFGWIGALSHLFADMLTNDGVWFLGKKVAPAQVVLLVRKIPVIGEHLLEDKMRTGTGYEDKWAMVIVFLIVPIAVLVMYAMVGGDVNQIIYLLRGA